jgi:uncharacterized spore protein YtfJ
VDAVFPEARQLRAGGVLEALAAAGLATAGGGAELEQERGQDRDDGQGEGPGAGGAVVVWAHLLRPQRDGRGGHDLLLERAISVG